MKAITVTSKHALELAEVSVPSPGDYQALVKIEACGICSTTDREIIKGTQPYHNQYPCVLGHEAVGKVVELGRKATCLKIGDRVTRPSSGARDAFACGWGGFAEYGLVIDRRALAADGDHSLDNDYTAMRQNVVPPDIDVKAAVLSIALGETASWAWQLPHPGGKDVVVCGTGVAGLTIALWWKLAGARTVVVIGRRDERLALAKELGADFVVNATTSDPAKAVRELLPNGAELFAEAVGQRSMLDLGLAVARPGGTIAIYGVPEKQEYDLHLSRGCGDFKIVSVPANEHLGYSWACDMIRRNVIPVDKLLSHEFALSEFQAAFAAVDAGKVVKGMIRLS